MADSSGALQRPPSLQVFLDVGCDLVESEVWIEGLAELVFLQLPFMPLGERRRQAQESRRFADVMLAAGPGPDPALWWGEVLLEQWSAEVYDDADLARRVQEALPTEVVARHRRLADLYRRPYPLGVRLPDTWWSCASCGAAFDEGQEEALVITGREDHSELRDELTYCFGCIELLADGVRAGHESRGVGDGGR
jgi:hypothetical protein